MSDETKNQIAARGIVDQITRRIEDEYGKPPAHPMGVRRLANTVAKRIGGDWWHELADRAVRQWERG